MAYTLTDTTLIKELGKFAILICDYNFPFLHQSGVQHNAEKISWRKEVAEFSSDFDYVRVDSLIEQRNHFVIENGEKMFFKKMAAVHAEGLSSTFLIG